MHHVYKKHIHNYHLSLLVGLVALCVFTSTPVPLVAAPPPGYYDSASGLTGEELRHALHKIIQNCSRVSESVVWTVIEEADEDPNDANNILDIYKNASYPKSDHSSWNREHSWPKSYGFADDDSCNYPYTDCHHIFACDVGYNSSRGNNPFDNCLSGCVEKPVVGYPGHSNWRKGSGSTGIWEVWDYRKGDIARAMLYMDVRYEGGTHGVTGCEEPDLILTDNRNDIKASSDNKPIAHMGMLSILLKWHLDDAVDEREQRRNDVIYHHQGNRNPFVDYPDWVVDIWGTIPTPTPTPSATPTPSLIIVPGDIVINEIDYDDPGDDDQSFIELKNVSDRTVDLSKLEIVGLNNGTTVYFTYTLEANMLAPGEYWVLGTTDDSTSVADSIDETMTGVNSIQNGPNDGVYIRLASSPSVIIDSTSYEGDGAHPSGSLDSGNAGTDSSTGDNRSLSRVPDGVDTDDNASDFSLQDSTPGESNGGATPTPTPTPTSTPTPSPTPTPASDINPGDIIINEIDYDNPGKDTWSFIEIKNVSAKSIDLSQLEIVGLNNGPNEYFTYTLDANTLSPGDYRVLGTTDDSTSLTAFINETMIGVRSIQNGPNDGVYVRLASSPSTIIDSVSYEGASAHPSGSPDSGNAGTDSGGAESQSLSRIPDGADTDDNGHDFFLMNSTPGESNGTATPTPTPTPIPQHPPSGILFH